MCYRATVVSLEALRASKKQARYMAQGASIKPPSEKERGSKSTLMAQ